MTKYVVKFDDGTTVEMNDDDPVNACVRAADMKQKSVVAWRKAPTSGVYVLGRGRIEG